MRRGEISGGSSSGSILIRHIRSLLLVVMVMAYGIKVEAHNGIIFIIIPAPIVHDKVKIGGQAF